MSAMRQAYILLGLEPGASPAEIKRSFRRLAMRWHPDRNPAPAAAAHFRALREAHDLLLKTFGHHEQDTAEPAPSAPPRGADRRMTLDISFEEAFRGGTRKIRLGQSSDCGECNGSGSIQLSVSQLCTPCRGSGRVGSSGALQRCTACNGRGFIHQTECPQCDGSGEEVSARWLAVELPPGLTDGDIVRLAGEGEAATEGGGVAGDLQLEISLQPHSLYRRNGRDLLLDRPVSAFRLLLGGRIEFAHPLGQRHLELEAGSGAARKLRIAGAGFPARGRYPAGDLVIQLEPCLPAELDTELQTLLNAAEAILQTRLTTLLPTVASWEQCWLDGSEEESG